MTQIFADGLSKSGVGNVMRGMTGDGFESALDLVLSLGTRLITGNAVV